MGDELEDLRRRHPLLHFEDVFCLFRVLPRIEQEIGAQASLTPYFFAYLKPLSVPSITWAFFLRVDSGAVGGVGSSACSTSAVVA
jgi:hypothetical protein